MRRELLLAGAIALLLLRAAAVVGAEVTYEYDDAGRLKGVSYPNGTHRAYTLDAAGNRTQVSHLTAPSAPASITVPVTNTTGSYSISWGASPGGTLTAYELWEATDSSFATKTLAYQGTALNFAISGKGDGAFYYRVRACNGSACSGYAPGANLVTVKTPPATPASITVPATNATGSYTITWAASATGTITAYELYEATSSTFTGETLVHNATALSKAFSGKVIGTYYYRVRACNGFACSGYAPGNNNVVVTTPPPAPNSLSVPSTSTGSFTVSWASVTGPVTAYELWEATNSSFSGQTLAFSGTGTSTSRSKSDGIYYYRVRACNAGGCSGYFTGTTNSVTVRVTPAIPAAISVPATSGTGSYTISWSASPTGTVTAYELWEATNSGFSGEALVFSGTTLSKAISGKGDGTYYYRVRACNGGFSCSGYRSGSIDVHLTPGTPPSITVPTFATNHSGSYSITWGSSTGTVTAYELYEATNSSFSPQQLVYSGTNTLNQATLTGRTNGSYYYRVRACNGTWSCSGYVAGPSPVIVVLPPNPPASITVPTGIVTTANYTVSWTPPASGPPVAFYQLYEVRPGLGDLNLYTGTATSFTENRTSGDYTYNVYACSSDSWCSSPRTSTPVTVRIAPGVPTSITVPATSNSGTYAISWGSAACCNAITNYELYEATNASFSGQTLVSTTATLSQVINKSPGATYYYRVRSCYLTYCSDYRTGANGVTVQAAATVNISDMSLGGGGYYPSGVSAWYALTLGGDILATPSESIDTGGVADFGDWIAPKTGMSEFKASAGVSCIGAIAPMGIFNTWRPLSQTQSWGASMTTWNNSGNCTITVQIATADLSQIVDTATIYIDLWAGE